MLRPKSFSPIKISAATFGSRPCLADIELMSARCFTTSFRPTLLPAAFFRAEHVLVRSVPRRHPVRIVDIADLNDVPGGVIPDYIRTVSSNVRSSRIVDLPTPRQVARVACFDGPIRISQCPLDQLAGPTDLLSART
jgi:hypothetical protein